MIRRVFVICLFLLSYAANAQSKQDPSEVYRYTALFIKAIDGDSDAMLEVATTLSNKQHTLFHPVKGHEYFLKLARNGDKRALLPLIDAFIDPKHRSYSPSRAWFYAQRTEEISPLKRRFIGFLAGKTDKLNMLDTDLPTDPFYSVAHVFSYFPFTNLTTQQWQSITPHFNQPALQPYLSYIWPVLYSPMVDGDSLYPSANSDIYSNLVSENGYYNLLPNNAQIEKVKVDVDAQRISRITLLYSAFDNQSARLAHYVKHYQQYFDLLTQSATSVELEGHYLKLSIAIVNDFITVQYIYPNQPLLREVDHVQ